MARHNVPGVHVWAAAPPVNARPKEQAARTNNKIMLFRVRSTLFNENRVFISASCKMIVSVVENSHEIDLSSYYTAKLHSYWPHVPSGTFRFSPLLLVLFKNKQIRFWCLISPKQKGRVCLRFIRRQLGCLDLLRSVAFRPRFTTG
jgi:hypothetical protein